MLASTLLLLAALPAQGDGVLRPREASWQELTGGHLDLGRLLPAPTPGELGNGDERTVDLAVLMGWLSKAEFREEGDDWYRSFGDLVAAFAEVRRDTEACDRLFARLQAEAPDVARKAGPYLLELVREEYLYDEDWNPNKNSPDDGVLFAKPWRLGQVEDRSEFWSSFGGDREVYQAAALIYADMEAIKTTESDYRNYPNRVGSRFEQIYPVSETYLTGEDPNGREYSFLRVFYESDLPFPYSSYDCNLRVLNRFDDEGRLVCDVYGESDDLYWMAGRDIFYPIETSDGQWVAYLLVRNLGLDIDGVPDGDGPRQDAMRGFIGNLKRMAEALYEERGGRPKALNGEMPRVTATGAR